MWPLSILDSSFLKTVRQRMFPTESPIPEYKDAIWISRRDGSEMREVGRYDGKTVSSIRWMPDGKHLSFLQNGDPYTVPVD